MRLRGRTWRLLLALLARVERSAWQPSAGAASAGSWARMARSSRWSSGPGSSPSSLGEQPAAVAVDLQRVALPAAAIEREHRLAAQALAQRIRGDERVELSDELAVAPELQERFDPVFRRREPEVVETTDLVTREVLEGELGQRRASPERERLVEQPSRLGLRSVLECAPAVCRESLEARGIDGLLVRLQT